MKGGNVKKKKSKGLLSIIAVAAVFVLLSGGCSPKEADVLDTGDFPDPPADQRHEILPIYMAWDGAGGETWEYEFSAEGVIEEGSSPNPPGGMYEDEDGMTIVLDEDPPGGRTIWFQGVSPGDVVVTFTTVDENGKVVDIQKYTIRVYEDMNLALLHSEQESFR
jgi:hypothetical protein